MAAATKRTTLYRMLLLVSTVAGLYVAVCAAAFLAQRHLVYFPGAAPPVDPSAAGLAFEERGLTTADGLRLHAWWVRAADPQGVVIVCHGNAGSIAQRLHLARAFVSMGLDVLLFDYRGYGRSQGRPGEEGTYLDAEAAYDLVRGELGAPPERIVLYGESLGAAVAAELAGRRAAAALVLESGFTSLPDLGAEIYPWLPVRLLARLRYATAEKLARVDQPVLIVHSPADDIVPFAHAERLRSAAGPDAALIETSGGHNDGGFALDPHALEQVRDFVRRHLGRDQGVESARER